MGGASASALDMEPDRSLRRPVIVSLPEPVSHRVPLDPRVEGGTGWRMWRAMQRYTRCTARQFIDGFERHGLVLDTDEYGGLISQDQAIEAIEAAGIYESTPDHPTIWHIPAWAVGYAGLHAIPFAWQGSDLWLPHFSFRAMYDDPIKRGLYGLIMAETWEAFSPECRAACVLS